MIDKIWSYILGIVGIVVLMGVAGVMIPLFITLAGNFTDAVNVPLATALLSGTLIGIIAVIGIVVLVFKFFLSGAKKWVRLQTV